MACQPTLPALRSAEAGYVAAVAAQVGGAALQGIQEAGQLINFTKGKDSSAKEVTPDSPDGKGKFAKVSGHKGVAFKHLKTGQIWVKNVKGHGGAQ